MTTTSMVTVCQVNWKKEGKKKIILDVFFNNDHDNKQQSRVLFLCSASLKWYFNNFEVRFCGNFMKNEQANS